MFLAMFLGIVIYALTLSNMCVIMMTVILKIFKRVCLILLRIFKLPYVLIKKFTNKKFFKEHV